MVEEVERTAEDEPRVLIREPETCLVADRGALVSIRRAMLTASALEVFRSAVEDHAALHPEGLVLLSVFRLDERFPLQPDFDADLSKFASTLRAVDRRMRAIGSVLEFGGVRATAMRVASRAVWALGRPSSAMANFDRLSDAAQWIAPHARAVGAPDDAATYVRAYRRAERELAAV